MSLLTDELDALAAQLIPAVPAGTSLQLLTGPGMLQIIDKISTAIRAIEGIVAGAELHIETAAPTAAAGAEGDGWLNTTTGDIFKLVAGVWEPRGNLRGLPGSNGINGKNGTNGRNGTDGSSSYQLWLQAGNTGTLAQFLAGQRGTNGVDGTDGADGSRVYDETYAPDDATGKDGDEWYHSKSLSAYDRYYKIAGKWKLRFTGAATAPATNQAPAITFNAPASGATVTAGTALTLTATATDDVSVATVEFLNGSTGASLGMGNKNGSTYTLPYTPAAAGALQLQAKATDGAGLSTTATVSITVQAAAAGNVLPVANAGADVAFNLPTNQVALVGAGTDADGTISAYAWTQVTGPNNATGLPAATQNVTAGGLIVGIYQFRLTVTDNAGGTKTDDVIVTVNAAATATPYQMLFVGDSLEGQGLGGSKDANGNDVIPGDPYATGEFGGLAQPRWSIQLKNLLSASFGDFPNLGKSGEDVPYLQARLQTEVVPRRNPATYNVRQMLGVGAGINDMGLHGRTAAQVYAEKKQYIADAKAAGFTIFTYTLTPVAQNEGSATYTTAQLNAEIAAYNTLVRNGQADMGYDLLIDFWSDSILGNVNSGAYRDGLHLSDYGNARKAAVAKPLIEQLAATGYVAFAPAAGPGQLFKNPLFDTAATGNMATGWVAGPNVVMNGNGVATVTDGTTGSSISQTAALTIGKRYRLSIEVSPDWAGKLWLLTANATQNGAAGFLFRSPDGTQVHNSLVFTAATASEDFYIEGAEHAYGAILSASLVETTDPVDIDQTATVPDNLFINASFALPATEDVSTGWARMPLPASGALQITGNGVAAFDGTANAYAQQRIAMVIGRRYKISVDVLSWTAGKLWLINNGPTSDGGSAGFVFREGATVKNWLVFTATQDSSELAFAAWDGGVGTLAGVRMAETSEPEGSGI